MVAVVKERIVLAGVAAAVLLVGCGESYEPTPEPTRQEANPYAHDPGGYRSSGYLESSPQEEAENEADQARQETQQLEAEAEEERFEAERAQEEVEDEQQQFEEEAETAAGEAEEAQEEAVEAEEEREEAESELPPGYGGYGGY